MKANNLKIGLVAFIDLLGFSATVKGLKTTAEISALKERVEFVQGNFEHKTQDETVKRSQEITAKTILAFSDCLVICVPVRSQLADQEGDFDILLGEIESFALAQGNCAVNSIFLRGGTDLGLWYRHEDTLISPAMVAAYELEHEASVPIIAITDDLYEHLASHPHRNFYAEEIDPISSMFKYCNNLPNGASHWFIDYIPIYLASIEGQIDNGDQRKYIEADSDTRNQMRSEAYLRNCRQWARWHADAIEIGFAEAEMDSIRSKYKWLADYHNETMDDFFGHDAKALLVEV